MELQLHRPLITQDQQSKEKGGKGKWKNSPRAYSPFQTHKIHAHRPFSDASRRICNFRVSLLKSVNAQNATGVKDKTRPATRNSISYETSVQRSVPRAPTPWGSLREQSKREQATQVGWRCVKCDAVRQAWWPNVAPAGRHAGVAK